MAIKKVNVNTKTNAKINVKLLLPVDKIFHCIDTLCLDLTGKQALAITPLPASGSSRKYYKIDTAQGIVIATYNTDIDENIAFIELSRHFHQQAIPVPEVLKVHASQQLYLQEYLGEQDLLSLAIENKQAGFLSHSVINLYRESIAQLVKMQLPASANLDFDKYCYPVAKFDRRAMFWDLNYFKYYFLKMMNEQLNDDLLEQDFETLVKHLANARYEGFMFRDFQARNIMIRDNEPYFIDYQGGRFGAVTYDLASLLYQAKAAIPENQKKELVDFYFQQLIKYVPADYKIFLDEYHGFVLIRLLQTLGAYGFRGLIQKKPHFIESLQPAIKNLKYFCRHIAFPIKLPYLFAQIEQL